jgi:hypothetical protein
MHLKEFQPLVKDSKAECALYSDGLRLRPNYLIYTLSAELVDLQKEYLKGAQIPWAEYLSTTAISAIVLMLKSFEGGIYLPRLSPKLAEKKEKICVFLLDPHLIDDFEEKISTQRQGVLIRRPILASQNFKETIELS